MNSRCAGPEASVLRLGVKALEKVSDQLDDADRALHHFQEEDSRKGRRDMSTDPVEGLPAVFGEVLSRYRSERKLTTEALAAAAGLSRLEVRSLECGAYGPTLKDFLRLAKALGEEPTVFPVNVVEAWRTDPMDTLHQSRASDFTRLFRLGYHHKPGDFRELLTSYFSAAEATHAAGVFNVHRHSRGAALLDTVTVYVRLDSVSFQPSVNKEIP